MSTTGNKFMDDMADAYSEAAKRNADAIKQGYDLIRESMSLPYDLSRIVSESSNTLSKGFADYVRLNVEHASHLLDLSRELSNELLASLERSGWQTKASSAEQPQQAKSVSVLTLPGYPGDLCRSAFILESKKTSPVLARVFHSRFVNLADETKVTIPIIFDPVEVTVAPDDKIRISVEAGIPENLSPGSYQSLVWIDGFPELSLKLIIKVYDAAQTNQSVEGENLKHKTEKKIKTRSKKK